MQEIWKDIPWYESLYQVSTYGNIKSLINCRWWFREKILKGTKIFWYTYIWLRNNNSKKIFRSHRLVAQAFLWLDINNKKILVCHKDDNIENNKIDNLFLWTHQDNMDDMKNKWRGRKWKNILQFTKQWEFIKEWDSATFIERVLLISHSNIHLCCIWKRKTAWWFIWKYSTY